MPRLSIELSNQIDLQISGVICYFRRYFHARNVSQTDVEDLVADCICYCFEYSVLNAEDKVARRKIAQIAYKTFRKYSGAKDGKIVVWDFTNRDESLPCVESEAADVLINSEVQTIVKSLLAQLEEEVAQIVLRYCEGDTLKEISKSLKLDYQIVLRKYQQGIKYLQRPDNYSRLLSCL